MNIYPVGRKNAFFSRDLYSFIGQLSDGFIESRVAKAQSVSVNGLWYGFYVSMLLQRVIHFAVRITKTAGS